MREKERERMIEREREREGGEEREGVRETEERGGRDSEQFNVRQCSCNVNHGKYMLIFVLV